MRLQVISISALGESATMNSENLNGTCLCGMVKVQLVDASTDVGVCHCARCRRWNSGPWMSLQSSKASVSGDSLVVYRSSAFAERGFCGRCGTHIFHRPQDGHELAVSAGMFPSANLQIAREICFDEKPPFYEFVAKSEQRSSASLAREWLPRLLSRRILRWLFGRRNT